MPEPICGAGDPAHSTPGWYACTFPPGHGPVSGFGRSYDHANPKMGAWWNEPKEDADPLIGVRKALREALLARPLGLSTEALKAAYNLVGAVLEAEGKG